MRKTLYSLRPIRASDEISRLLAALWLKLPCVSVSRDADSDGALKIRRT